MKSEKLKSNEHIFDAMYNNDFVEDLVAEVKADFKARQMNRKNIERQWQLNMNFMLGNQYCAITELGEIENYQKQYFWQEREVYNHIAPLIEARVSRLSKIRPTVSVVPASTDENDINTAKTSKKIVNSVFNKLNISEKICSATTWSEICGTSFYKLVWDKNAGLTVGIDADNQPIKSGEIDVTVCSPYEIFPDSNNTEKLQDCLSIIHAKAFNVKTIKSVWGVDVEPENIDVLTLDNSSSVGGLGYTASIPKVMSETLRNSALVIERYEKPTQDYPNGRVIIVAGNKLLHIDELPYINLEDGQRGFPFIKQSSIIQPNNFWGISVIERMIPVQRSFNAVKNRKHEFLNRIALGILTVEDGSVDTDNLEEEGLSPGKVLIYRQGSEPPKIMDYSQMPEAFDEEENKLISEFTQISGISDVLINASVSSSNMSGVALEIIMEQETNRLNNTAEQIKYAVKEIGKQTLRLYKQFVTDNRISKLVGENGNVEMFYWKNSDISSDDVVLNTENELGETLAQRREMIFQLLNAGLLQDDNGKINSRIKSKTLEMLGFGNWEASSDLTELNIKRADKENLQMFKGFETKVFDVDEHSTHIDEHSAFMMSDEFEKAYKKDPKVYEIFMSHINEHKQYLKRDELN